ncbi:TIGR02285 family protein [Paucibacter sp. Y2R2-4]|uniref:TIGR02285 family protein n=1 Tax=Paucibacter sp. Y2R2-4 TaxID=2893553 RepID=UPI0021E46538|nr:TIGR02285 family protein [Paucibacter sp. Y2R2-4]MCV2350171.1 TIGR02285 family protein [Paucibacter sp. Y2R2-4]
MSALSSIVLFALLLTSPALQAQGELSLQLDTVTWISIVPESVAADREAKPEDELLDRIRPYVAERWPEVKHQVIRANPRRAWQMISSGENVCQVPSVRTAEREKLAYFSNTFIGPPMQLIVHRSQLKKLPRNAAGEIDLEKLLKESRLQGGLVDGRSYGDFIDAMLTRTAPGKSSLTRYSSADYGSNLLPMLGKGRIDYTIDYEVGIAQARRSVPNFADLVSQPIAGASQPLLSGVVCPRTPWGLAAIQGIDKILGTPEAAAMLRESAAEWLTPETRRVYGARMEVFFKNRAKPSVIR